MDYQVNYIVINAQQADQRIDNFLIKTLKGVPRTCIYRLLRKGRVRINKKRAKPCYRLQGGEILRIPPLRTAQKQPEQTLSNQKALMLEKRILYEDDWLMIINKPAGMAVHGGSGIRSGIIESLRHLRSDTPALELVHRLDKATSGCLMIAKKRSALRELNALLHDRLISKTYLALVSGKWCGQGRCVTAPLQKNVLSSGERIVRVAKLGKPAKTLFKCRQQFASASLLEVRPVSGRTHQIRVHAAHIGYPIIGDDKYGDALVNQKMQKLGCKRLFLHAWSLQLQTTRGMIKVEAPLDDNLKDLLDRMSVDN